MFESEVMDLERLLPAQPSKADRARRKLLQAAILVFGEKGLKGATVREIAAEAGQNIAAIAYYFGTKEKLYRAALEAIVRELRHALKDVLVQVEHMRRQQPQSPTEALRLLKLFLSTVYLRLLSRNEVVSIGRLVVREQTQPSAAFEILYENAFKELHTTLSYLVGTAAGADPFSRENIIRTHALMGQVWFFVVGRETILRRLNWDSLESPNAELVTEVFCQNLDMVIKALRSRARTASSRKELSL